MESILDKINAGYVFTADGAMGTRIQQASSRSVECPELLNLTDPELIESISASYLEAGAEIIQTNTFGGSRIRLDAFGLGVKVEQINRSAVLIAKKISDGKACVSGVIGPCGKYLEPFGELALSDLKNNFLEQAEILIESGVDLINIETMMDISEGVAAIEAVRALSKEIPISAAATFNKTPAGFRTYFGNGVNEIIEACIDAGANILGANCGAGMKEMVEIAKEFRRISDMPLIFQPNAGLPAIENNMPIWNETPDEFGKGAEKLLILGVNIIGGCCGTAPEHIKVIRETIERHSESSH